MHVPMWALVNGNRYPIDSWRALSNAYLNTVARTRRAPRCLIVTGDDTVYGHVTPLGVIERTETAGGGLIYDPMHG